MKGSSIEPIFKSIISLRKIIFELNQKEIEIFRMTKVSVLLLMSGITSNSIPRFVISKCIEAQNPDGGWISNPDTIWNTKLLLLLGKSNYEEQINKGLSFLHSQCNSEGLWGRSKRDISRIPVTGLCLFFFPELGSNEILKKFEFLWFKEKNSITYKAAYVLMAFRTFGYEPTHSNLIEETIYWLIKQQRVDGGFAPWRDHVIDSDVFCTSLSLLGLLSYPDLVPLDVFKKGYLWLVKNQLPSGLWRYHQIEDGSAWGLYALVKLREIFENGSYSTNIPIHR